MAWGEGEGEGGRGRWCEGGVLKASRGIASAGQHAPGISQASVQVQCRAVQAAVPSAAVPSAAEPCGHMQPATRPLPAPRTSPSVHTGGWSHSRVRHTWTGFTTFLAL